MPARGPVRRDGHGARIARLGGPNPGNAVTAAAAVLSLLPVLRARRQAVQQAYRDSPVAYPPRREEELTPQTMPARAGHWVRRFVTGI